MPPTARRDPVVPLRPMATADRTAQQLVWFQQQQRYGIVHWVVPLRKWVEIVGGIEEPAGYVPNGLPRVS